MIIENYEIKISFSLEYVAIFQWSLKNDSVFRTECKQKMSFTVGFSYSLL